MKKVLYFVRHGCTEWNAIARMQGQWNSNLDDPGREQAEIAGRWLAHPASTIAIVSHRMIGKAMLHTLLDLHEARTLSFHQPNDHVFRGSIDGDARVAEHFDGGRGPCPGLDEHVGERVARPA
jgi:broad specificity phosphatase PhoE